MKRIPWVFIAGMLFSFIVVGMIACEEASAQDAKQFVGIGGGFDFNDSQASAFDFSWGYAVNDGQYLATTMRVARKYSEFTEDFLQRIVTIDPIKLELYGVGSIGASTGNGLAKFDVGGGIGALQPLDFFTDKLKGCGVFVGGKFMKNDIASTDAGEVKAGGLSRLIVEFVYRW